MSEDFEKRMPPPPASSGVPPGPTVVHIHESRRVMSDSDRIIMVLLIFLLPPLAVWYKDGFCSSAVCLNICLTLCFVLPGVVHAVYYCLIKRDDAI